MATDNPVVYLFVVAPVALLLGTSAGLVPEEE